MKPSRINVLIACEESQAECKAFRERGFNAFSCDIQPARFNAAWHIHGDVTPLLDGMTKFRTMDGKRHSVNKWHLIVAHPPCTFLCKCGSFWYRRNGVIDSVRHEKMLAGRKFFFQCLGAKAVFVAVENPLPMAAARLPRPSCFIQPYWYGVKYSKKTLYWTKNLPPLLPEIINPSYKCFVQSSRGKYRSRTFPQVAAAMARQWGDYILDELTSHHELYKNNNHSPSNQIKST